MNDIRREKYGINNGKSIEIVGVEDSQLKDNGDVTKKTKYDSDKDCDAIEIMYEDICGNQYKDDGIISSEAFAVHRQLKVKPYLTTDSLIRIMDNYHNDNESIRKKAQEEMLGVMDSFLIHLITTKYTSYIKEHMSEMMSAGYMGILLGMKTYDPKKGKPTTWFIRFINHEIQTYINSQVTHSTQYYIAASKKVFACIKRKKEQKIEYTIAYISIETGLSKRTIEKCMRTQEIILFSLSGELEQKIPSEYGDPQQYIERLLEKEMIDDIVFGRTENPTILTADEQKCIILRYGFDGNCMRSLNQISKTAGISKYYVVKILESALSKMNKLLRACDEMGQ